MIDRPDFPPFHPHPLFRGGHAQTLAGAFLPSGRIAYRATRHVLPLGDGDRLVLHDDCPPAWTGGGPVALLVEVIIWLLIIAGCILLVQGTRRIPVQFAKRVVGNKQYGGVRNYIPLKVNAAGVMPIIFAQAIVLIPMYISQAR